MSDRELLELAARAAGVQGRFIERMPEDGYPGYSCGFGSASGPLWNPLTDDGDALRLAVQKGMLSNSNPDRFELFQRFYLEELAADHKPSVATRRAIVRAAAELGRNIAGDGGGV